MYVFLVSFVKNSHRGRKLPSKEHKTKKRKRRLKTSMDDGATPSPNTTPHSFSQQSRSHPAPSASSHQGRGSTTDKSTHIPRNTCDK